MVQNSLFVALAQGSVAALYGIYIVAARVLGNAGFGEFTLALTIAILLGILPGWGTNRYTAIIAARKPRETADLVATNLGLTVLLALFYLPLVGLIAVLVGKTATVLFAALLLAGDVLARNYANLLRLIFRARNMFALEPLTAFAERTAMIAGAAVVLWVCPSPTALAGSFVAGRALGALFTTRVYLRRVGPLNLRFRSPGQRHMLAAGTPLALRGGLATLSFRIDTLLLGTMRSTVEVGLYGAVYKLIDGVLMLPTVVTGVLGPSLSAAHGADRRDVVLRLYRRGMHYLLIGGLFLTVATAVLAEPMVRVLYGDQYLSAAPALRLLAFAMLFIFLRQQAVEVLDNVDLRGATVGVFAVSLSVNLLLNLMLIPRFGYLGAAGSTVVTEALVTGAMIWTLRRAGYSAGLLREVPRPAAAAAVSALVMLLLIAHPFPAVFAGVASYLVILTVLGTWDEKDRLFLRQLIRYPRGR
ncbi:flippase [soil metagenome]